MVKQICGEPTDVKSVGRRRLAHRYIIDEYLLGQGIRSLRNVPPGFVDAQISGKPLFG
jgi:hypothetical protein